MSAVRIVAAAAGLEALKGRLRDLAPAARTAVAEALKTTAAQAAATIREALPADIAASVRVEDGDGGSRLVIDAPDAREREFGTSRTAARPLLRPRAAESADRARPAVAAAVQEALREGRR